ncbi:MAG: TonB-dependent receptor [Acidobacteria bacterium]|nr:TonB-dependent receptor [Acidobacteriota bacterium]
MVTARLINALFALLLVGSAGMPRLFSQNVTRAEVSGVITDASGARVPRAAVVATHTATKFSRETQTNESGIYVINFLPIGDYTLSVEASGFRKYVRSGISLSGGDRKVLDIAMELGELINTVEVTAAAPLVDKADASIGVNLDEKTIETLPINGRDFTALLALQPGAVQGGNGAFSSGNSLQAGGTHEPGERMSISMNGAQDAWSSNNFTMDGIDVSEIHFGVLLSNSISMEAIAEVVIDSSNYSAENGRSASGKVNFISKAGGNDIHGSLFEFYRGKQFQANDYFLNAAGRKLPPFKRNQFGGSIGGPIKKDKLFYFGTFERIQIDRTSSYNLTTLTKAFKSTLDPAIRTYFNFMPEPTTISRDDPRVGLVTLAGPLTNLNDVLLVRLDWNLGSHQLFGRWNRSRQNNSNGAAIGGYPDWPVVEEAAMDNLSLTWSSTFGPTATNGFTYGIQDRFQNSTKYDGFQSLAPKCPACGVLTVNGVFTGEVHPNIFIAPQESRAYFLNDVFRKLVRSHSLSMGGEWRESSSTQGRLNMPGYTYNNLDDLAKNSPVSAGNQWGYDPFTMGPAIQQDWGFFLQDDWKVIPRLTLNLGVRYDFVTANPDNAERPGRRPVWDNSLQLGILNCKVCKPGNFLVPGTQVSDSVNDKYFTRPGEKFRNGDYDNVAPRLGFAYDLFGDGKSVLRGGYGIVYQVLEPATFGGQRSAVNGLPNLTIFRSDVPSLKFPTLDFKASGGMKPLVFIDPDIEQGWTRQWNLSIQRELGTGNMVQAAYLGNRSLVLSIFNPTYQLNPFYPDANRPGGGYYLDPCCASVTMRSAPIHSDYHSLQLTFKRAVAKGLAFTSYYTWAHALAEYPEAQLGGFYFRKPDITYPDGPGTDFYKFERSAGFSDVRHNFNTSFLYELPFGNHPIGRGWQLSGVFDARTGVSYSTPSSGFTNRFRGNSRVDLVPGVPIYTGYVGPDKPYLNKAAFAVPSTDPKFPAGPTGARQVLQGNTEQRMIYGPGRWNADLGLIRNVHIREKQQLQIRIETFNVFNHMNWGHPSGINLTLSAPNFGYIIQPAQANRQIQFGIRYVF